MARQPWMQLITTFPLSHSDILATDAQLRPRISKAPKTTTIHLLSTAASAAPVRSVRDRRMLVVQRSRVAAMLPSFEHMIGLRLPKNRAFGNSLAYAVTGGASLRTISKPDG